MTELQTLYKFLIFGVTKKLKSIIAMFWLVFPLACKYFLPPGLLLDNIIMLIGENVYIKIAA